MTAERLMFLGGMFAFLLTLRCVYRERLREKYAVIWLIIATLLLAMGVFPETVMIVARMSRLSYPSAVLFLSLAAIYLFSMSVSVSLSQQHRRILALTQEVALLRMRLENTSAVSAKRTAETTDSR